MDLFRKDLGKLKIAEDLTIIRKGWVVQIVHRKLVLWLCNEAVVSGRAWLKP